MHKQILFFILLFILFIINKTYGVYYTMSLENVFNKTYNIDENNPKIYDGETFSGVFKINNDSIYLKLNDEFVNKSLIHILNKLNKNNKEFNNFLYSIWLDNIEFIGQNYKNSGYCDYFFKTIFLEENSNVKLLNKFKDNIFIKIKKPILKNFIICDINRDDSYKVNAEIKASKESYRIKNILIGLNTLPNILRYGETLSVYNNVSKGTGYVEGYALTYNSKTKKVETVKTVGGGLCGVSTIVFQTFIKIVDIDIIKRYNHLNFYYTYYNNLGLDATIYGDGQKAYKDLLLKNNHGDIYIEKYSNNSGKKFIYGINLISFKPFNKIDKIETIKNNKCVKNNIIKNNTVIKSFESCYHGIY